MTGCGVKQATSIEPGTTDENSTLNDSLTSPENENNSNESTTSVSKTNTNLVVKSSLNPSSNPLPNLNLQKKL